MSSINVRHGRRSLPSRPPLLAGSPLIEELYSAGDVDLRALPDGELLERLALAFRSNLPLSVRDAAGELYRRVRERRGIMEKPA